MFLQFKSFENSVGKGEIACNKQFLLFSQCFLPFRRTFCPFHQILNCSLQTLSVWKSLKFVVWERVHYWYIWYIICHQHLYFKMDHSFFCMVGTSNTNISCVPCDYHLGGLWTELKIIQGKLHSTCIRSLPNSVLLTQNNCLNDTILMSTDNIGFDT